MVEVLDDVIVEMPTGIRKGVVTDVADGVVNVRLKDETHGVHDITISEERIESTNITSIEDAEYMVPKDAYSLVNDLAMALGKILSPKEDISNEEYDEILELHREATQYVDVVSEYVTEQSYK